MAAIKFIAKSSDTSLAALNVARTQLGVMEVPVGSNNGPKVRQYLAAVGLGPGYAWCMAFVYWCFDKTPGNPLVKTGGVMAQFNQIKGKRIYKIDAINTPLEASAILPGDIFIMSFPHGQGHTGIIEKTSGDSVFTIEGNTNGSGGREGIGVFSRRRKISEIRGLIRVLD